MAKISVPQRIREVLALYPKAKPKAVVERLAKRNIKATASQVSNIKHHLKKAMPGRGGKKKTPRLTQAAEIVIQDKNGATSTPNFSSVLSQVLSFQRQVKEIGGVENAKQILADMQD